MRERPIEVIPASTPAAPGCEAAAGWTVVDGRRVAVLCGEPVTHVIAARNSEGHMPSCDAHVRRLRQEHPHIEADAIPLAEFVAARRAAPYVGASAGCACAACAAAREEPVGVPRD